MTPSSIAPVARRQTEETFRLEIDAQVAIERFSVTVDQTDAIEGQGLLKVHVQLSGQRVISFDRHPETQLVGATTLLVMHGLGLRKVERLLPGQEFRAVTVSMAQQRVWDYFDAERCTPSPSLRSLITHTRAHPRLARASPTAQELAITASLVNCQHVGPLRPLYLQARAAELFSIVIDRFQADGEICPAKPRITQRDRQRLADVRDFLASNYVRPPMIHELARDFGLNRNKLCGGFIRLYGISIYDFCRSMRLEKARQLLAETDYTLKEIAFISGFASVSAFSSSFAKQFGARPSRHRLRCSGPALLTM